MAFRQTFTKGKKLKKEQKTIAVLVEVRYNIFIGAHIFFANSCIVFAEEENK